MRGRHKFWTPHPPGIRQGLAGLWLLLGSIIRLYPVAFLCHCIMPPSHTLLPFSKISRLGKYTSRQAGQCSYRDTVRLLGWSQLSVCFCRWNSQKVYASWPTPCLHFVEDASAQNHVFTKIGCKEISSNCIELSGEIWCGNCPSLAIVLLE